MYLCICNAITEGAVGHALTQGCGTVGDVFRHVGERPQCGRCVPELCRRVQAMRNRAGAGALCAGAVAEAAD